MDQLSRRRLTDGWAPTIDPTALADRDNTSRYFLAAAAIEHPRWSPAMALWASGRKLMMLPRASQIEATIDHEAIAAFRLAGKYSHKRWLIVMGGPDAV